MSHERGATPEQQPVDYAAVGATQAGDLLQYPPEGFVPVADQIRLGSGVERFRASSSQLFNWIAQRHAGVTVSDVHVPAGDSYIGIRYDDDGTPLEQVRSTGERRFGEDGVPEVSAGATLTLSGHAGGVAISGRFRVVFVIEESHRSGFALGSVESSSFSGEQSFVIEHRDDDSVWFVFRAFSRPLGLSTRLVPALHRRALTGLATAYLRAMSPAWSTPGA
ncbi:DUF1990 family protein [Mycetocola reblochoni]|uniref:A3(2) GLYCOGEN METABOLISM CLUSTERI n=2 Tax=Mycetocola reblochoni TaxID=331618 RepID=A0A1R4K3T8_9MICO|nr:DUF1990 family protein [Mycetocola reblochoni]RLP69899.1 DUF1990 family protein [Mycetocola reblochoni]SJN38929.1 A3(2) GLYCOGEN METABOLISM CLUSTERI [Mycetocola reblochoni REB411]